MIDSEIKTDRILLFFGLLIYPFWGYIFFVLNPEFYDPFWHRYVISGYILAIFCATFFLYKRRKLLDYLNYSIIYIVTIKQAQLIQRNELSYEYFIGYIVIIVSLISYFKDMRHIVAYSVTCVVLILLIFAVEPNIYYSKLLFYVSAIFTITFFLSFIYYIKISNQQKLLDYSVQVTESEEKYRVLLESAPDAIVMVTQSGEIVSVNNRTTELFGYTRSELENQKIEMLIPERYREAHSSNRDSYKNAPKIREMGAGKTLYGITKSGREFPVEISLSPVKDNSEGFKVIALIRDVSQRIATEKELSEIRNKLQEKEMTEKISRAKSEFISKMSHEIRTPLNGIHGFSNLLLKEPLNGEQMKYVENIKFSSNLLKTLIDDILDNSKIEAGKIVLEEDEVSIRELFSHVSVNFEDMVQRKNTPVNIRYQLEDLAENIVLLGDSLRISQIIMNLMSNAIKFSEENREIRIDVRTATGTDGKVKLDFSVSNFGIGIPEEQLQEIFQPYVQVSNEMSRKYGGTGLGLSIVKSLIDIMNGKITVTSGEQTVFHVVIPLKTRFRKAEVAVSEPVLPKNDSGGPKRILVAEDNPMNQFLIQAILEKNNFEFTLVENGEEVLQEIENKEYSLVLMDIMMPVMDGITCTRILKEEKKLKIPVIALTADIKTKSESGFENLFDGYIKKPFEEEELLEIMRKLV